jgi:hypothetical protein
MLLRHKQRPASAPCTANRRSSICALRFALDSMWHARDHVRATLLAADGAGGVEQGGGGDDVGADACCALAG